MYNQKDVVRFTAQNALSNAMREMSATGDLYVAAQNGAFQAGAEEITGVRYNDDGSLTELPTGGVWLCGMPVGARPVGAE